MRSKRELVKRYSMFAAGIFVNALGVAFITRSMLGTGPTTSIPYVISLQYPLSFGTFNFAFNVLLLLLQIIILRKDFHRRQLLQIPVSFVFSACIDVAMFLTRNLSINYYSLAIIYTVLGSCLRAYGVSLSVVADVVMLSPEAFVKAIADKTKKEFSVVKIFNDVLMTGTAVALSYYFFKNLQGVREGTLITALLVGPVSKFIINRMGFAHHYFSIDGEFYYEQKLELKKDKRLVLTITSLAGSGGRIIARMLGDKLGIPVYDKELVDLVAEKGNFSKIFVKSHNEKVYTNLAEAFILGNYSLKSTHFETYRNLFTAQSEVITELANSTDCIIIGHCSNYVLKNNPNVLNICITADDHSRRQYIKQKYNLDNKHAAEKIKNQDNDTDHYYYHFTGTHFKDSSGYHVTIDSSLLGLDGTVSLLEQLVRHHYLDVNKVKVSRR